VDTYAGHVLFVHVSSPDDEKYIDANHCSYSAEDGHALEELLCSEDRVEVDCVRRNIDVATERGQVRAETLSLSVRRQRSDLSRIEKNTCQ